mgnify:CR=1 FL=1
MFTGTEWSVELIDQMWKEIEKTCKAVFNISYNKPRLEIITAEQMLYNYSVAGLPSMYSHWEFGQEYQKLYQDYKIGHKGLAYEMVINTNPLITYLMESNTAVMQTLTMAHAVCGHGSFFKENYLFKEWTDGDGILDYLAFAQYFIRSCEEKYGDLAVSELIEKVHYLEPLGIDYYKRNRSATKKRVQKKIKKHIELLDDSFDELYTTAPRYNAKRHFHNIELEKLTEKLDTNIKEFVFPEENVLYLLEKISKLKPWQKEIVRIVRKINQYFYPQRQTKVMNEGWASFIHYELMTELYNRGKLTEGAFLEFLENHTNVVSNQPQQPNPYALGIAIFQDIKRMCLDPTDEDRDFFPQLGGKDWKEETKYAMVNFRDESFIRQYLSPKVMRDLGLYIVHDDEDEEDYYEVTATHDTKYYKDLREKVADKYLVGQEIPQIVWNSVSADNTLNGSLKTTNDKNIDGHAVMLVYRYIKELWGANVFINTLEVDLESEDDEKW